MKLIYKLLPKLIRASFQGDLRAVESASMSILRKIKKDHPDIADEIAQILSYQGSGANLIRSIGIEPPPQDSDSHTSLVSVEELNDFDDNYILSNKLEVEINYFLKERELASKLLLNGIAPPNSILLHGIPGVGKTHLVKYIAYKLNMPLINLDLASNISSYLGKTGKNLKSVLDYAKSKPSIIFLDEFDAIAKRRDDSTDLGELKRIVNVLLKELENWPSHSVFLAATNHPEILDKAIWRRFDRTIEIGLPEKDTRKKIWEKYLNTGIINCSNDFLELITDISIGVTPSDVQKISEHVLRQVIIYDKEPYKEAIQQLRSRGFESKITNKQLVNKIIQHYKGNITQAKIAEILGISTSTVNHHLKNS